MASSFVSSVGKAATPALTTIALDKLFGTSVSGIASNVANLPATGFNAGGFNFRFDPGTRQIRGASDRGGLVNQRAQFFAQEADQIGQLREGVTPGFGALTQSRVQAVSDARNRALGNLRDSLQRRRVRGSSFGEDALIRAEAEFAKQEQEARATSFLQELDLQTRLIDQQFNAARGSVDSFLTELNIQAELGARLAQWSNAVLADNAQFAADLMAQEAVSDNSLLGSLGQSVGTAAAGEIFGSGGGLGSIFGGTGAAGTASTAAAGNAAAGATGGPTGLGLSAAGGPGGGIGVGGGAAGAAGATGAAVASNASVAAAGNAAAGLAGGPTGLGLAAAGGPGGGVGAGVGASGAASGAGVAGSSAAASAGAVLGPMVGIAVLVGVAMTIKGNRAEESAGKSFLGQVRSTGKMEVSPNGVRGVRFTDPKTGKTAWMTPAAMTDGNGAQGFVVADAGDGLPGLWHPTRGLLTQSEVQAAWRSTQQQSFASEGGGLLSRPTPIDIRQELAR